jgi:hypothetical protein
MCVCVCVYIYIYIYIYGLRVHVYVDIYALVGGDCIHISYKLTDTYFANYFLRILLLHETDVAKHCCCSSGSQHVFCITFVEFIHFCLEQFWQFVKRMLF